MLPRFIGVSWESQGVLTELNNIWQLKPHAGKNYKSVSNNIGISEDATSFSNQV
jgi:hypothetical protein